MEPRQCEECGHAVDQHRRGLGCTAMCGEPWAQMLTCRCKGESMSGNIFPVRCTGYWPFSARPKERRMEGGLVDRKGHPLHTLEDYRAGKSDFVSVSGDYTIFPYGQRITLTEWPDVIFRVVDTGSHFHGAGKVYREPGREPFDICVASPKSPIDANTYAVIVPGDHWDKQTAVVALERIGQASTKVA